MVKTNRLWKATTILLCAILVFVVVLHYTTIHVPVATVTTFGSEPYRTPALQNPFGIYANLMSSKRTTAVPSSGQQPQQVVKDCVTGEVVRTVSNSGYKTKEFTLPPYRSNMKAESAINRQKAFNNIFTNRVWIKGSEVSTLKPYSDIQASGKASQPAITRNAQEVLTNVIASIKAELNVEKIKLLDIPCGDLVWMHDYLKGRDDIEYIGVDIVRPIIEHHKKEYKGTGWTFIQHDIAARPLNINVDLIFSRQMLQHLSNYETLSVLNHLSRSGSKYLLTTTFLRIDTNVDLATFKHGRFRKENLELLPFALAPPLCVGKDPGWSSATLGLWELPLNQVTMCSRVRSTTFSGNENGPQAYYSCT